MQFYLYAHMMQWFSIIKTPHTLCCKFFSKFAVSHAPLLAHSVVSATFVCGRRLSFLRQCVLVLSLQVGSCLCVSWPLEAGDFTWRHTCTRGIWTHTFTNTGKQTHTHTLTDHEQICVIMLLTLPLSWPSRTLGFSEHLICSLDVPPYAHQT